MFETSLVRARAMGAHHRYRLLTLSLAFHASAIAAVLAATLASTRMPDEAPRQMATPFLMPAVDLKPPAALGVQHPKPAAAKPASAPAAPRTLVAPQTIPDRTPAPTTAPAQTDTGGPVTSTETGDQAGPLGDPNGVIGGVGTLGGGTVQAPDATGPLPITGDVRAPIVLHRVLPEYPRVAMTNRVNGTVTVECIIDKTGHIREARVVKSSFAAFNQPAINAVEKWLFAPGTLHGQPVDTIFQLTVVFQVQ